MLTPSQLSRSGRAIRRYFFFFFGFFFSFRMFWPFATGSPPLMELTGIAGARGHFAQELSQRHEQSSRVVTLHGMAGTLHLHPATVGQGPGQALGVLVVEHVALRAAHHQGGTRHLGHRRPQELAPPVCGRRIDAAAAVTLRSEEHTSELQSLRHLVCRLLLEKKNREEGAPTVY